MILLSSGDVSEVTGLPNGAIRIYCAMGAITPKNKRSGPGNHMRFTLMQTLALAFGAKWRKWGAQPRLIAKVVQTISRMEEEALLDAFAAGRTMLTGPEDNLCEPPDSPAARTAMRMFELSECYHEVKAKIAALQQQPRPKRAGRIRGLAG